MKKFLISSISLLLSISVFTQDWTEPVNISNMEGMDRQPDITIDSSGNIHCIWVHDIESNFTKIYHSKSTDDGITWSIPEDISQNDEKWVGGPKIVSGKNDNLFLTYDYNVGDPNNTFILFKHFAGVSWSEADTLSHELPGSRHSKIVLDTTGRLFCFWHHDINYGSTFYKYFENDQWSDTIEFHPGNDFLYIDNVVCDKANNLHSIGGYHAFGETHEDDRIVYANMINNNWSPLDEISEPTAPGEDVAVDSNNIPHVAFRQDSPNTPDYNDSTIYRYLVDTTWSEPELVVEDPRRQKILIDDNNKPNIFDIEKTAEGSMLVHHYKQNNTWEGYVVAESEWNTIHYSVTNKSFKIYTIYNKPDENNFSEIYFTKTGIITQLANLNRQENRNLLIFPNPFRQKVNIHFVLSKIEKTQVDIYTLQGTLIKTLLNEGKPRGQCEIIWDGKDKNGKQVSNGQYLIRVRVGNHIISRSVNLIK